MIASGNIYGLIEQQKRLEETAPRIYNEWSRIGCSPGKLKIVRRNFMIAITYEGQTIDIDPSQALLSLKESPTGLAESSVWDNLVRKAQENHQTPPLSDGWFLGICIIAIALYLLLLSFLASIL